MALVAEHLLPEVTSRTPDEIISLRRICQKAYKEYEQAQFNANLFKEVGQNDLSTLVPLLNFSKKIGQNGLARLGALVNLLDENGMKNLATLLNQQAPNQQALLTSSEQTPVNLHFSHQQNTSSNSSTKPNNQ